MIGCNSATNGPQHEVAGQQEKEVGESQQETRPFAVTNVDEIQKNLIFHDGNRLTRFESLITSNDNRIPVGQITTDLNLVDGTNAGCHHYLFCFLVTVQNKYRNTIGS